MLPIYLFVLLTSSSIKAQTASSAAPQAARSGIPAIGAGAPLPKSAAISSETKPLLCGNSTTDASACYFTGDYCSFTENFDKNFKATDFLVYGGDPSKYSFVVESGRPVIKDGNLRLPLVENPGNRGGVASIVSTTRFLNFGSFEARLKTIGVSSVVTTLIGISNVLDEIDFEWTPKNEQLSKEVQANWYYQGEAVYNVNFMNAFAPTTTYDNFHTYRVDWTPEKIDWSLNGVVFHTQTKASLGVNSTRYPSTPMRISFGVWQALDNEWAGPSAVNRAANPPQNLEVIVDYIKVIGTDCGGGTLAANPPLSKGFEGIDGAINWTPETSSVLGSGSGAGNAVKKMNWGSRDYVSVVGITTALAVAVYFG